MKERIYATLTCLAILAAISATGHATPSDALLSLAVGVTGIAAAGFLAEVVAHQVAHQHGDRHPPRSSCSPSRGRE